MRFRKWMLLLAVAFLVILLDQVTKALVVANLALYEEWMPIEALRPYFTIHHIRNTGAAFGIFPEGGTFFMVVAFIVVGVIIYFYRQMPDSAPAVRVALGLQLGGALGNLVDRLRQGYVVDFLDAKIWPVSNISDISIVSGVCALLLLMWWEDRRARQAEAQEPPDHATPDRKTVEEEPGSVGPGP